MERALDVPVSRLSAYAEDALCESTGGLHM